MKADLLDDIIKAINRTFEELKHAERLEKSNGQTAYQSHL